MMPAIIGLERPNTTNPTNPGGRGIPAGYNRETGNNDIANPPRDYVEAPVVYEQRTASGAYGTPGVMLDKNDPNVQYLGSRAASAADPYNNILGKDPLFPLNRSNEYNALGQHAADQYGQYAQGALNQAQQSQQYLQQQGLNAQNYSQGIGSDLARMGQQQGQVMAGMGQDAGMYGLQAAQGIQGGANQSAMMMAYDAQRRAGGLDRFAVQQGMLGQQAANRDVLGPQGPSAAQAQLQSGLNQSMGQNLALARSGRGFGNSAASMSQAVAQNGAMGQQAANDSAMLRASEDQAYRNQRLQQAGIQNQAGVAYGQQALQGLGAAGSLAQSGLQAGGNLQLQGGMGAAGVAQQGQQMGANMYAQGAGLAQQGAYQGGQIGMQGYDLGIRAAESGAGFGNQGYLNAGQLYGQGQQLQQAGMNTSDNIWRTQADLDQAAQDRAVQYWGIDSGIGIARSAQATQLAGAVIGAVGGGAATAIGGSDRRMKKNIKRETDPLLDVGTYSYDYTNPDELGAREGRNFGPMAQELERTPAGKSTVVEIGGRKMVDTGRLSLVLASEFSRLSRELDDLRTKKAA